MKRKTNKIQWRIWVHQCYDRSQTMVCLSINAWFNAMRLGVNVCLMPNCRPSINILKDSTAVFIDHKINLYIYVGLASVNQQDENHFVQDEPAVSAFPWINLLEGKVSINIHQLVQDQNLTMHGVSKYRLEDHEQVLFFKWCSSYLNAIQMVTMDQNNL